MRGNPDSEITIYRAVPQDVKEINPGDWVTTTKEYAVDHIGTDDGYTVISKKVKAGELANNGDSIHEFGFSPKALPTDEAARMARAQEMGFETNNPLYHGTPDSRGIYESGFSTPKERYVDKDLGGPYFFTDMSRVARSYADDSRADDMQNATPEVIKAFVKNNNPLRIDARKAPFREIQLENVRANLNKTQLETLDEMMPDLASREVDLDKQTISTDGLVKIAKALGNDSILIRNVRDSYTGEGSPSDVLAVFDRRSIRSVDAQFDPAKAGSADILAGLGVVGAGAALSQQDGFDYGALSNVVEESNGQISN